MRKPGNVQFSILQLHHSDQPACCALRRFHFVFGVVSAMSNDNRRHDESPSEYAERVERAEAEASRWFNDLAAEQIAIFNERMATAREFKGVPRWDRVRDAAKREFERTTVEASRVAALVMADMMAAGEVSEATSYAFDEAKVSHAMQQAAE